jgi:Co/Zn/Cd efflux system component
VDAGQGGKRDGDLRRVIALVATLNAAYFGVEFGVALEIGSVSLFADSIDFLEDAALNLLILVALGWSARRRARLGIVLAGMLLVPGLSTLWTAWRQYSTALPPEPEPLTLTGAGALAVNVACALLLGGHRERSGSVTRAAFLSARNDVLAGLAIVAAGLATAYARSAWPDLVVGLGIALLHASAAREVYAAARRERQEAVP